MNKLEALKKINQDINKVLTDYERILEYDNTQDPAILRRVFTAYIFGKDQGVYFSIKTASEHFGVSYSTIRRRLNMETVNPILGIDFKYN